MVAAVGVSLNAQVFEFDQGFDSGASGGNAVIEDQRLSQTFTVGIEGELREVHLNLFYVGEPVDDLFFRIARPDNGDIVAVQRIHLADIPQSIEGSTMVPVVLSTPLGMQLGSTWELRLSSIGNESPFDSVNWSREFEDPYPGGEAYVNGVSDPTKDFSFFTFVDPQSVPVDNLVPVPEPQTYGMLFAAGLLAVATVRKIRQR